MICRTLPSLSLKEVLGGTKMEGDREEASKALPEELAEKILAMMPYPSIFKARLLSKSWNARFEPLSLLHNEEQKRLATSFQTQVTEWSHKWDTFCPICTTEEDPIVYNQVTRKWQRLPLLSWLSFLPKKFYSLRLNLRGTLHSAFSDPVNLFIEGPFLYGTWEFKGYVQELHVANMLTREWKQLPGRPEGEGAIHCIKLVMDSPDTYHVIVVCDGDEFQHYCAQIYDSKSGTWRSKEFVHSNDLDFAPLGCAYFNGVFYMVTIHDWHYLLAFNVDEGTLEELRLSYTDEDDLGHVKLADWHLEKIDYVILAVCNVNLVMIVMSTFETVRVLKIDLASLRLLLVAQCPAASKLVTINTRDMISSGITDMIYIGSSDASCLFFKTASFDNRILGYNSCRDDWSFFNFPMDGYHWSDSSFRPGQNPFMAV